jgi:hypothetical protein
MIVSAYSILDTKTGAYAMPFFLHHDALAIRAVIGVCREADSPISQYSEDYVLYKIGHYDDNLGLLTSCRPENLGNCAAIFGASLRTVPEAAQ